MAEKLNLSDDKRKTIYRIVVIVLSAAIIIVLGITFIPRMFKTGDSPNKGKVTANLDNGYSCIVNVNYDGTNYELKLEKPKDSGYLMTFIKPETLNSLSFETTAEGLKIKKGSLELVVDPTSIPQKSIYDAVINSLDNSLKPETNATTSGNDTVMSGKIDDYDYSLTFDSSMKPKSLSIPKMKFEATINDFKNNNN